ncbi:HNH endonuclease [Budvicia aquatica]|uniref:HNH endonuclease n=1 Tax=Budvicia aquatica TaxID=82979 RepID=UPI00208283D9|nr:HNH endonuclease [Budvicia aquatica]GKX50593.1 hypothetical protein SOASR029_09020 [Budvicia aquatica]
MFIYKHTKPISVVNFNNEDIALASRLNDIGGTSWDGNAKDDTRYLRGDITKRKLLKEKIKKHLLVAQCNYCYYCGISFKFFGPSGTHIDHFYPKDSSNHYGKYTFEPYNLVLACFRCNGLDYKRQKDYTLNYNDNYMLITSKIVHPHIDDISLHFNVDSGGIIIPINENPDKATFMISEFDLNSSHFVTIRIGQISRVNPTVENQIANIISARAHIGGIME